MLTILLLMSSSVLACTSSLAKVQTNQSFALSGLVIAGTVESVEAIVLFEKRIKLKDVKYFKGCGPVSLAVRGFKGTSLCSVNAPNVGEKVAIFGCLSETGEVTVHELVPYHGLNVLTDELSKELSSLKETSTCEGDKIEARQCSKLESSFTKPSADPLSTMGTILG